MYEVMCDFYEKPVYSLSAFELLGCPHPDLYCYQCEEWSLVFESEETKNDCKQFRREGE